MLAIAIDDQVGQLSFFHPGAELIDSLLQLRTRRRGRVSGLAEFRPSNLNDAMGSRQKIEFPWGFLMKRISAFIRHYF